VTNDRPGITDAQRADAQLIWEYHKVHHELRPCSAAIVLGCNDLSVATYTAELYHAGLFPVTIFSGATSRDTVDRFPRGEGFHFRDHAVELGVPQEVTLVEPEATNTGQNITLSREVLRKAHVEVDSVLLVCMPYMERRAYATCRRQWPEIEAVCASAPIEFDDYLKLMGDDPLIIDMMVGDFQRVMEYPKQGFAIEQDVPADVVAAFTRLRDTGYTSRLLGS
jgi:uncharacterized SAM-binding protein YcdF (DUF218 family)